MLSNSLVKKEAMMGRMKATTPYMKIVYLNKEPLSLIIQLKYKFQWYVIVIALGRPCSKVHPRGGTPRNSWWGCAARVFISRPYFRPKHAIFHTRFQT